MTLAAIRLERFTEELKSLHGWSNSAVVEFSELTVHAKLPREDWIRIAREFASETPLPGIIEPELDILSWGVAVAANGKFNVVKNGFSEADAKLEAEELNAVERAAVEDQGIRWFAVKISINFPDSE